MASIIVLGVKIPFVRGGQEVLVQTLVSELKSRGHDADVVELPLSVLPKENLLNYAAMWRSLDLLEFSGKKVDLVIATKFPTYYARHPKKSVWLVHQHRQLYDLYGSRYADFSDDPRDEALRRMLVSGDCQVLGESAYIGGISGNVCRRLSEYNSLKSEVLYPPLPLGKRYTCGEFGDYVLSVGRLCSIKRVDLMIKALPLLPRLIRLKIAGLPDEPGIMEYYQSEIAKHHLADRVDFLGRVSDEELLALYAKALVVYYAPHNEDYGYVTLEAFASGRPVIAAHDSGGVLEFVRHEENGLVLDPTVEAIAVGVKRLAENRGEAKKLGLNARNFIQQSDLWSTGWDHVINRLLSPLKGC